MLPALKSIGAGIALSLMAHVANAEVSDTDIRNSYHEKAALTQLMRWYQYYENSDVGINNQLDILTEDFSVSSPSGTAKGHKEYETRVKQLPDTWRNAHELQNYDVTVNEDGTLGLKAEIIYTNVGMAKDGAVLGRRLGYEAVLEYDDGQLPRFSEIVITPGEEVDASSFKDVYVINRLTSLVNYWIALVEHPGRAPEPFREILAPAFDIKFGADRDSLTKYEEIAAWVAGPVSSLPATRHAISPIDYKDLGENRYELTVGFDWQGIRPDDKRMTAKTKHVWVVSDDPSERFARIEKIRVEVVEPFAVIE